MDEQAQHLPESGEEVTQPAGTQAAVSRRGFLQAALATAVVAGGGGAALALRGLDQSAGKVAAAQAATATPAPTVAPTATAIPFPQESWLEPWVWRPSDWLGQQLSLNVVENQNPGPAIGLGNIDASLFSYGGITPGPTIRMRGDQTLFVKLRNFLAKDFGTSFVREFPDPAPLTAEMVAAAVRKATERGQLRQDFCIGEHTNGIHSNHVTNMHTHGLHVRPGKNVDGTQSDNIILRVMSHADWQARQASDDLDCKFLLDREQVGEADYEFRLGDVEGVPTAAHPPGTHWYHPHSHGATHNQVSSGMAGFLIVEGDVDDAINSRMTGTANPDPTIKSGDWDYRERLMLVQRVSVNPSTDKDAPLGEPALKNPTTPSTPVINGSNQPKIITMRPGAVERWRILNGSVDGRGYKRFMVLAGEYVLENDLLRRKEPDSDDLQPVTGDEVANAKQQLYQLAMDGVTLVSPDGDYFIKDLAAQNAGAEQLDPTEAADAAEALALYEACYRDEQAVFDCYTRPNEVYMAPANRTDVFFQAPADSAGQIFTVMTKAVVVHGDNYQAKLQEGKQPPPPGDIIIAYVYVSNDEPLPAFDVMSLQADLPPAPAYLQPIGEEELVVTAAEVAGREDVQAGDLRTRTMAYSGWGAADFPLIYADPDFVAEHPELEDLIYSAADGDAGRYYMLAPNIRTMAINAHFDLPDEEFVAPPPRKFDPDDPERAQMLVNTAEEWAVYNNSLALWGDTNEETPGVQTGIKTGYAMTRAEGQANHADNPAFQITSKGVDHPFHIHINPFYLLRLEVPDEAGNLVNILEEPRWQDVVWLPRSGGRVVFRSRFADFIGQYVHHCHILLHEDNGMMHVVQTTQYVEDTNYVPKTSAASFAASAEAVSEVYRRPTLEQSYRQSISFVDPNAGTGQVYPGFDVELPR